MLKKTGFTLAEVLITIGILGVIAAVTIPALMANVDKNSWANALKTNISIVSNAFAQMKATEQVDDLREAKLWNEIIKTETIVEGNSDIKDLLGKYLKIEKMIDGLPSKFPSSTLQGDDSATMNSSVRFYLANSAALNIIFLPQNYTYPCDKTFCDPIADIFIDVNGDKRPNTYGKDIYRFYLDTRGILYAYGSDAVNEYDSNIAKWDSEDGCQGKDPNGDGLACTSRVIEEGCINYK